MEFGAGQSERKLHEADITHAAHRSFLSDGVSMQAGLGVLALRAPGLAGIAGIAALLAFATGNKQIFEFDNVRESFSTSLALFFLVVVVSTITPAVSWAAQFKFNKAMQKMDLSVEEPHVRSTNKSQRLALWGHIFHATAILLVLFSLLALILACFKFYSVAVLAIN